MVLSSPDLDRRAVIGLISGALAVVAARPAVAQDASVEARTPPPRPAGVAPDAPDAPTEADAPDAPDVPAKAAAPDAPAEADAPDAPAAPARAAAPDAGRAEPAYPKSRFSFGSYGRVVVASDGRGGAGRDADIVAHGTRIDEGTYAELELRRDDEWEPGISSRIVTTLAIGDPIFHYDGKFDAKIALRNLYVEERGIGDKGLSFWAGSRMYRGDDIYLLDFWPLDNLNTVGGGVRFDFQDHDRSSVAWHMGLNRVDDPFQHQTVIRPAAENLPGTTNVDLLDRPRLVSSLKLSHIEPILAHGGVKGVLYGEVHRLPAGQREIAGQPGSIESVPGDGGIVIGAQVGLFTGERDTFVNLFFRHARGLAAYGELGTPLSTAPDRTTNGAKETLIGLAGNWEYGPFGVIVGGYFRSFRVESTSPYNFNNLDEGIIVARPHVFFSDHVGVAVEGAYEAQQRGILDVTTEQPLTPKIWRFGVIPFLSPAGVGDFKRPQLRLIWAVARRNDATRALYTADDVFSRRRIEQFFGIGAEWWFNSTSYSK